jgi:hypothetical protein
VQVIYLLFRFLYKKKLFYCFCKTPRLTYNLCWNWNICIYFLSCMLVFVIRRNLSWCHCIKLDHYFYYQSIIDENLILMGNLETFFYYKQYQNDSMLAYIRFCSAIRYHSVLNMCRLTTQNTIAQQKMLCFVCHSLLLCAFFNTYFYFIPLFVTRNDLKRCCAFNLILSPSLCLSFSSFRNIIHIWYYMLHDRLYALLLLYISNAHTRRV